MTRGPERFIKHGKHARGSGPVDEGLEIRLLMGRIGVARTIEEIAVIVSEAGERELAADLRRAVDAYRKRGELGEYSPKPHK
jgi:hypothetical protein